MTDNGNLSRFVSAQDAAGTYERAVAELRAGRKTSHWMWFVFPQIAGLGFSEMSKTFAIASLDEARTYLSHPILGSRLRDCASLLADGPGADPVRIFGSVDAQKLQSSMTLFARADPTEPVFRLVLEKYFSGVEDTGTVDRL